ncbi:hypothetical protein E2C01_070084 [Portunus trituberculatus]|uniref:Uncharacterized protein n=1 Tax=Portunus trituberculatus TaxID=210409 RepID=A0A5B7HRS4_PORTR|nr:hypothetical protein [Portunus trituberculatus]
MGSNSTANFNVGFERPGIHGPVSSVPHRLTASRADEQRPLICFIKAAEYLQRGTPLGPRQLLDGLPLLPPAPGGKKGEQQKGRAKGERKNKC